MNYPSIFIDYEITKGKMDDVFLSVTGKALEIFKLTVWGNPNPFGE